MRASSIVWPTEHSLASDGNVGFPGPIENENVLGSLDSRAI